MGIFEMICFAGTGIFWVFGFIIAVSSNSGLPKFMRIWLTITALPTLFCMLGFLTATAALEDSREKTDMLYKKMKQQEKYELIQEPVYRKIK